MIFNNYNKSLEYLFSLERQGIKYDLKNIKLLLNHLDNPEKNFQSVHIAGTNGKGSVSSMISSILQESGYKCGLYTSPHILDFRERIRINGIVIEKKYILNFINVHYSFIEKIKPSFFEVTTALAIKYFSDKKISIAIIETGMGGRLDSTNTLSPLLCIITSISKDHSEYLGNSLKQIAYEKAGIIKKNGICIIGDLPETAKRLIKNTCKIKNANLYESQKIKILNAESTQSVIKFQYQDTNIILPLSGDYQIKNIKMVLQAVMLIKEKFNISPESIKRGFEYIKNNTGFGFRFEIFSCNPFIILDVSHNTEALHNLKNSLAKIKYKKLIIIFGIMADKDVKKCVSIIEDLNPFLIVTTPDYKRAMNSNQLYGYIKNKSSAFATPDISTAINKALELYKKGDLILVTGSFYLVNDFLKNYSL